ncbi:hypothetical protein CHS0354_041930 [Potamilus streckersoni]|uniref:LON peptidase N-terminal domain and RING finger protein 3 n=1 Tax=Potamilus streckersoni TaxID=2493646 RepID=A0AAE0W204_9BIVA|nr:hypothetical protein CHS0354_041930 [Potamilus streckersoni]
MVDLAREAFETNNFDLAAEIYDRTIREHGPSADLYLGLADSYARAGNFRRAIDTYSKAFRYGKIVPDKLKHLVTALIKTVAMELPAKLALNKNLIFTCLICRNLFEEPVTIRCGHSFCRNCILRDENETCRNCGTIIDQSCRASRVKCNVLLTTVIGKWFPSECRAARLRTEANAVFEKQKFDTAIELYNEAIKLAPRDHILLSNRSHAYAALDKYKEALEDAEKVVMLRPDWPKGYFRKGTALYGLGHYEEAVVALLQCLALDTSVSTAKLLLSKTLHKILSSLPPDDPKTVDLQKHLNPSLFDRLIQLNFNPGLLLPQISTGTVDQLKQIIGNTVSTAANFIDGLDADSKPDFQQVQASASIGENEFDRKSEKIPCSSTPCSWTSSATGVLNVHPAKYRSRSPVDITGGSTNRISDGAHCSVDATNTQVVGSSQIKENPTVDSSLVSKEDFECSLCYRLLYQPVTTPCGHTFCCQCLYRCLDYCTDCPLCKSSLVEYLAERRQTVTQSVEGILKTYFPEAYAERRKIHEEEMVELASMGVDKQHEIPIFVCTLAFPKVPCPLHIFEPRYRLMVRQCMESGTRQFGMCICIGENEEDFSEHGCMLEIRDMRYFPDGRSLVDCIGGRRFRVLSKGKRDGYNTAKVEFVTDNPVQENEIQEMTSLLNKVYDMCKNWIDSLPSSQKQRIFNHFGDCPGHESDELTAPSGPMWLWWMIAVLPVDPRIQLAMLSMSRLKERLLRLSKIIGFLNSKKL